MASVLLLSALPAPTADNSIADFAHDDLRRLTKFAARDRFDVHTVTHDPRAADIILFVERAFAPGPFQEANRRHRFTSKYPEKVFVSNGRYYGVPFLPGVYGGVRNTDYLFESRIRSGTYLEVCTFDYLTFDPHINNRPYLYSFVGAVDTWPQTRKPLLDLTHPRGLIRDTSNQRAKLTNDEKEFDEESYHQQYVDLTHQSKFVLCPRGDIASSMRLFEVMRMGRAPVIISDHWLFPEGPDWSSFSVQVPEDQVHTIPDRLENLEPEAEAMGHRARAAWENWFASDVIFHRTVEWCLEMRKQRSVPESLARRLVAVKMLMPFQVKRYLRSTYRSIRKQDHSIMQLLQ